MLCEKCHKTEATVHVTEVVAGSGQMKKRNLCEACWNDTEISKKLSEKTAGWISASPTKKFLTVRDKLAGRSGTAGQEI
jgi:protein-arginine kinase activator protein McsA